MSNAVYSSGRLRPLSSGALFGGLFFLVLLGGFSFHALGRAELRLGVETLTLEEVAARALRNNRSLKNAEIEVSKARSSLAAARTERLPSLNLYLLEAQLLTPLNFNLDQGVLGSYPFIGPVPAATTSISTPRRPFTVISASVTQPLSQQYKIGLNIGLHKLMVDSSQEKLRSQQQEIVNQVKRLYYAILQSQSACKGTEESIKFLRELKRLSERYGQEKVALRSEIVEVQARLARAEQEALSLRHQMASQKEQLNDLMGRNILTEFQVKPVVEEASFETNLEAARTRALKQRAEIREARLKVRQAEYDRWLKKAEYFPDLSLTFQYLTFANLNYLPENLLFGGLMLTWEPFDWGRKSKELAQKAGAINQTKNLRKDAESQILIQVNNTFRKLRESRGMIRVCQLSRDAAREKLREMLDRYSKGAALLKDVLQVQANLAEADHQCQQALLSFWMAKADFEKAIGEHP